MTPISKSRLADQLRDSRRRTFQLTDDLTPEQMIGPRNLAIINPLPWEIGHTAYFHELWCLRHRHGLASLHADSDQLYDSVNIAHDIRWDLPIPSLDTVRDYMDQVQARELQLLQSEDDGEEALYLYRYALFHEDMHTEAFTYTRQTLNYPVPLLQPPMRQPLEAGPLEGDVAVPDCEYTLGAVQGNGFCFDNEKWGHTVHINEFTIARAPVTNQQFLEFVEAGGYSVRQYWDDEGWQWQQQRALDHPAYWRKVENDWQCRFFNQWQPLASYQPAVHISWYEARAWCRWAGRRLPTEAEWELAASGTDKRTFPWGDTPPSELTVNMDSRSAGCIDVAALPAGDSPYGCRQMIGNVWEWTDTIFCPYPGFVPDMYASYSQPLFNITRVLRGGAWTTRSRMIRNTWRNYYGPDRNDVFAGFRTCRI